MTRALRIGINALFLIPGGVGGTEIYLRNLLAALARLDSENEYFVFINAESAGQGTLPLTPQAPNFRAVPCAVRAVNRPARLVWEQFCLPAQAALHKLDVLFSPGFTSPLLTFRCPKVTVIHDLQHVRQPENFRPAELAAWRALVWISARFSQHVVTVSQSSKRDIMEAYGLPAGRVTVIPHGVEEAFFDPAAAPAVGRALAVPYLLSVSTIHPHKNWSRWLEAYGQLAAEGCAHHLVIAGLRGNYYEKLRKLIEQRRLEGRVHITGWLPRPELLALFRHADALVFPSTFEGFGMPVLEAMAAGVPVACSDIAPLRELAAEAALFFDPYSPGSIAGAVRSLVQDSGLRRRLTEQGRRHAARFTWRRAARETLAVLRNACGLPVAAERRP
jgi:glycosyltransferase involved in cell wall biosynthesis